MSFGRKSSILYDNNFIVGAGVQNMREFTDFISEYKYFVQMYVLPLMGLPNISIGIKTVKKEFQVPSTSEVFYDEVSHRIHFADPEKVLFYLDADISISDDSYRLARNLCKSFFKISEFQFLSSKSSSVRSVMFCSDIHRDKVYQLAVQRGICVWALGKENESIEKLLSLLEEWSVRTYEGKKVTFGFVIDPGEDFPVRIPAQKWFKFLNDDYSAVLTDNIHSLIQLNENYDFIRFCSLTEGKSISSHKLTPYLPLRFSHSISKYIKGNAVGIFLLNNGDIVISKNQKIMFVKRNLHWLNFSYEAFCSAISQKNLKLSRALLSEVYATTLDVSFAHTGGIIAVVKDPDSLRNSAFPILKPYDDLMIEPPEVTTKPTRDEEMKQIKRQVITALVDNKSFQSLDRKLRSELAAMDGACIMNTKGDLISFGAIIRNDAVSSGGARGAASKTLSKYGLAIKISTDGYVELYVDGEKIFAIK